MRTLIVSPERVDRTLIRLAYEVVERNRGAADLMIFGILQSGAPVAEALSRHIGAIAGETFAVFPLDVEPFRDDRCARADPGAPALDVTDKKVILVDDVLFTGRTVRAALDAIIRYGRPASIQLVALIDRGHREVPIQANYVGRTIETKHRERVEVDAKAGFGVYVVE